MSKSLRLTFAVLIAVALSAVAMAQSTTSGAIGGVVSNPNKEVVPGASVTVVSAATNKEDAATTDGEGRFRVVNLQPGTYKVTVNATGFTPFTQDSVVVEVGRVTSLDVPLSIGAVSGTVEVTSEAPVINTSQQDFSTNVNQTSINELPINGRRWSNFALLAPGTVPDGNFGLISFRGVSGLLNNSTVDGGDNNQAFFAEERGRTRLSYSTSQSAVREFQVNTSNYSAEYGRAAGGVVNTVTKSGTNEFHGQAFYYQRNNKWGARNPFATLSTFANGQTTITGIKPKDVRHQFGGNIGGPIVKDKAFFFFNYDQQKRNFPGLGVFSVPNYLSTVTRPTLITRGLTDAQIDSGLAFLTSLTGPVPRRGDQKIFFPKVDWHITQDHTFTATYNRVRWASPAGIQTQATNTRGRASFGDDFVNIDSLNLRLASTLSPILVNEFRFQWSRDNEFEFSQPPLPGEPTTANGRSPDVFLTSGIEFGKPTFLERVAFPDEKRLQFADTVTLSVGNHTLKWGGDVNRVDDLQNNLRNEAGAYSYGNINDFIVDYVNWTSSGALRTAGRQCATNPGPTRLAGKCYTSPFNQGFGPTRFDFKTSDVALFLQDDWRFSPRLTLNLGLRWEYEKMPKPFLAFAALPKTQFMPDDRNNFGPRVGFAYDVNGDGKTSVRGGYGIYYGRIINSTILNALTNTGNPAGQVQVSLAGTATGSPIFPNILATPPPGSVAVQYFARNFAQPQIHQMDLVVEREVARNTVVSASYLFSYGKYLPNFVDTNLNPPTSGRSFTIVGGPFAGQVWRIPYFSGARPMPAFGAITEIRSDVTSKYNALVLQANRRLTNGLQFQTSYTLSRSADTGQSSTTFTANNLPFNAFDQQFENGLSNFDRRHKFVASVVYNTNFYADGTNGAAHALLDGWTIAPIFNALSGARYTGTVSSNANTLFGPNQAGGINGSNGSTRFALLPRNAFTQPRIINTDLRISRRFNLKESVNLELLGEAFNLFNRTQVSGVNTSIYAASVSGTAPNQTAILTFTPSFGTVNEAGATLFRERQLQFAVRFEF
ncbi:MAG TPA: TonB-dependent receptor [Pyrinomonadaceae bacterium]|nr:TonB-dependent receptor [Pyrinomonadaceae bacterium]